MILTVVMSMGQPVVGSLGGPANALRRRLLAPIGELVSEVRQEHVDAAAGADAEVARTLKLDAMTLAEAAWCRHRSLSERGLCPGSGGLIGFTCRTSSTTPTLPDLRVQVFARSAEPRWRLWMLTSVKRAIAMTGKERAEKTAVPPVPALRHGQILGGLGKESIERRGSRLTLGEMQRIQFEGGGTRLGRRLRRGCELPMLVRKFGGSDMSLGRRLRRGCEPTMLVRKFGGSDPSLGTARTNRGCERASGCRRETHIFRFPSATTLSELPSGKSARGGRMRGQDRRLRNASTR